MCEFVSETCLIQVHPKLLSLTDVLCGMCSVATTTKRVKILDFKLFYKHFVFIEKSDFDIKKVQKKYIDVNVCLDVDCVDKKEIRQ